MAEFKMLKKALLNLDREQHHLEFLTSCKKYGVIPKFLQSRCNFASRNLANMKSSYELRCLNACIRSKHAILASLQKKIYGTRNNGLYHKFATYAVGGVFYHSMALINRFREEQAKCMSERHKKKLDFLTMGSAHHNNQNSLGFINLSNHTFQDDQLELLNKGPKYIQHKKIKPKDYVPQLEDIVRKVNPEHRNEVRCQMFLAYNRYLKKNDHLSAREHALINSIRNIPNVVILSTDKSNKLAAVNSSDFLTKMTDTINSLHCTTVSVDPLTSIVNKCNRLVKEFKTGNWPDAVKKMVKTNNLGLIPRIFAVIKDHKQGQPLRPIVPKCEAPTYFIEKAMALILKDIIPPSPYVLSSTNDFIHRLDSLQLPTSFSMYSLDIVALYPSIDMSAASIYISSLLASNPTLTTHMQNTVNSAFQLIMNNNFFRFNNQIYLQSTGAPMGSPVSGMAAECVLRPLEETFLASTPVKPICWFRFVDDIFILWNGTDREFEDFVKDLNSQNPKIQFTTEKESQGKLPFLDVLLEKKFGSISRSVFRKKINSNCTIPSNANTTITYKKAAFKSYVTRALKVCTPDNLNDELDVIRSIAIQNGYSLPFINAIIHNLSNKYCQHPPTALNPPPQRLRIPISYFPGLHERLIKILREYNIQLIAQSGSKLKNILKPSYDAIPSIMKPGVYEIPIVHQDGSLSFYIGQTSRKLQVRIKEHQADIKNTRRNSAIARALSNNPMLTANFHQSKIVAPFSTQARTLLRESVEIYCRRAEIVNEQDSFSIPAIWLPLLT